MVVCMISVTVFSDRLFLSVSVVLCSCFPVLINLEECSFDVFPRKLIVYRHCGAISGNSDHRESLINESQDQESRSRVDGSRGEDIKRLGIVWG